MIVVALLCQGTGVCLAQTSPATVPAEQVELTTLEGQLKDSSRSPKTRLEAAGMLLVQSSPRATEILLASLAAQDDPALQIAVAGAIAAGPTERKEFIEPLWAMLRSGEPLVRGPAARALARYRGFGVAEKLIALAKDKSADAAVRADVVVALSAAPDKRTVETMVGLLDDPATAVRSAAAESLVKLTNIRAFGDDAEQWKQWWRANKDKDRSAWVADLADSLARAKAALEADNARLRDRLTLAMSDLYEATPPPQREALLMGFLKDALPDARLAGLRLVDRRIASNELVSPEVRSQVRALLADGEDRVRQEAAIQVATLADSEALKALLDRLAVEDSPSVREALLKAVGQLRQGEALPAVLAEIGSRYENVSAAAAAALVRIASKVPLDDTQRREAAEAILLRYRTADPSAAEETVLREALLSAMGAVGEEPFMPVLQEATKDPSAKVRLAAVASLAQVGKVAAAPTLVAMTADSDRGVRQAAIAALGAVGGKEHLPIILRLTQPAVEEDAVVRQQAWDATLSMLTGADEDTVFSVAESLTTRSDALAERIKILQMLVDRLGSPSRSIAADSPLEAHQDDRLGLAQRQLGAALMQANRPAEAAVQLGQAYPVYVAGRNADAPAVWQEWVDAMLAADDPACVTALAAQSDEEAFAAAFRKLLGRLSELRSGEKYQTIITLATEALERLSDRRSVTDTQRKALQRMADEATARQSALDEQKVAALVSALGSDDESARKAATELQTMSTRAVAPLLAELRKAVTGASANPKIEKALVEVLRQISPKFSNYDTSASIKAKLELITAWSKLQVSSAPAS
jgi:HEAT repeat protein